MKNKFTARRFHLWFAIILVLPMLMTALTGIMLSYRGNPSMNATIPATWVPGASKTTKPKLNAYAVTTNGTEWVGTNTGLWQINDGQIQQIGIFSGQEISALALLANAESPIVGLRSGVWVTSDGDHWSQVLTGRLQFLATTADGKYQASIVGKGILISADGMKWQPFEMAQNALTQLPEDSDPRISFVNIAKGVHTGSLFLGSQYEWLWNWVIGGTLTLLCLTGVWMWRRNEKRKVQALSGKKIAESESNITVPAAISSRA